MADEISVRTKYSFTSDDGTNYGEDFQYSSDNGTTAGTPKRYMFVADASPVSVLNFNTTSNFRTQINGSSILMIVNRDERIDMNLTISTSSMTHKRTLKPKEFMFLDVTQGDQGTIGGGGSFTYAAENVTTVTAGTNYQSARGELICIRKS